MYRAQPRLVRGRGRQGTIGHAQDLVNTCVVDVTIFGVQGCLARIGVFRGGDTVPCALARSLRALSQDWRVGARSCARPPPCSCSALRRVPGLKKTIFKAGVIHSRWEERVAGCAKPAWWCGPAISGLPPMAGGFRPSREPLRPVIRALFKSERVMNMITAAPREGGNAVPPQIYRGHWEETWPATISQDRAGGGALPWDRS